MNHDIGIEQHGRLRTCGQSPILADLALPCRRIDNILEWIGRPQLG
jgi:hypothetical protein